MEFFNNQNRIFALLLLLACSVRGKVPCAIRSYGSEQIVCVCNATYCDTADPVGIIPAGQYALYSSTKDGLRLEKTSGQVAQSGQPGDTNFVLNLSSTHQSIIGFGGAFTDAAGINILSLSSGAQELLLRSYFSTDGIEYTMGRVPIAGCDFSTRPYTYDDVPNDTDLSEFNLTMEDTTYKIPIIKRAMALSEQPIKLLSAAWTAPPWMKTNGDFTGFAFLKQQHYQLWADYLVKFLDKYKDEGLGFWGMSTGNEPMNGIIPIVRFNSMGWTPFTQSQWVAENLGPAIRNSQHRNVKLLALDDQRFTLPWWIDSMLRNNVTAEFIDGIAVHWYWDNVIPPSLLAKTHNNFPHKFIIATEASKGDKPWDILKVHLGSWSRAEDYITDIIQDVNHWVTGWIDWNLALDVRGGPNWANNFVDAAVIVNATADEFYKQPMFYAIGHFSKFVLEGAVHVSMEPTHRNGIYVTAFKNPDNRMVVIMYNQGSLDRNVTVQDREKGIISLNILKNSFNTLIY